MTASFLRYSAFVLGASGCATGAPSTESRPNAIPPVVATTPTTPTTPNVPADPAPADPAPVAREDEGPAPDLSPSLLRLPTPVVAPDRDATGSVTGDFGVVTSVEEQATRAGRAILEAGGNAVDAAVATALALAVTHPSAGNLGGGGFLIAKMGTRVEAIDFREDAPRALTPAAFEQMIGRGAEDGGAVGVPGTPAGLHLAHARHGRLSWRTVVEPALALARDGFVVGPRQALTIGWARRGLERSAVARELFLPKGRPLRAGERAKNERIGRALERLANEGRDGFYRGPTAADLVKSAAPHGLLTEDDLARYQAELRTPLFFDFGGYRVITMPPPSGGGVVLTQALHELAALHVEQTTKESAARLHLLAEVSRRAQAERKLFVKAPHRWSTAEAEEAAKRWFSAETWLTSHPFDPARATRSASLHPLYQKAARELEHTTHLSVVDRDGNAVSCTVTLSASFGARVVSEETGIVLNNSVASFSLFGANTPAPGERTVSSMAPTLLVASPDAFFVLGSPGGDTIPSTLTQLVVALAIDGKSLRDAVQAPRFHQGFVPDEFGTERRFPLPENVTRALVRLGHDVKPSRAAIGDANVAAWFGATAVAIADPREGGVALAARPPGDVPPAP